MPLTDLSDPDVLFRDNWDNGLRHDADGTPVLAPDFVAEAGPRVWVVDVRGDEELVGATGHIPGVWRMPLRRVAEVADELPVSTPVVLVCDDGRRSATAARLLAALGMTTVAAMAGGMRQWRSVGYFASRDPAIVHRELRQPAPGCGSDGRPLDQRPNGAHLTKEAVTAHVGDPAKVRRVKLAALLLANQTSCVDGREDRAIIGTPGGDAGELVLGLAAVEEITGQTVDEARMPAITRAFGDTFGGIYLHTDNGALNRLVRALRSDPRLEPAVAGLQSVRHWERFLRSPPRPLQSALLEHLVQPEHVGCGHLQSMLMRPAAYRARTALVQGFLRAFYLGLWDGAPDFEWVVLGGEHHEGAVLNVMLEGALWPFSRIPMVAPAIGGMQTFVNHPQVVAYFREQTSEFFARDAAALLPVGKHAAATLSEVIPRLGRAQATATLEELASGLPLFEVTFGSHGTVEVTAEGFVKRRGWPR